MRRKTRRCWQSRCTFANWSTKLTRCWRPDSVRFGLINTVRRPCLPAPEPIYGPRPHNDYRARSSAGEHYLDMVGVTGSIPVAPTILFFPDPNPGTIPDI